MSNEQFIMSVIYKRDLLVVDHPVSMQFYASLLQLNKWPMSMLKLIPLLMLGIGIYFCTIFFVGCGQYVSGSYICIILRLVAIQELLVRFSFPLVIILILWIIKSL